MVRVGFTISQREFLHVYRVLTARRWQTWAISVACVPVSAFGYYADTAITATLVAVMGIAIPADQLIRVPRRIWRKYDEARGPQRMAFGAEGTLIAGERSESRNEWSHWHGACVVNEIVVLFSPGSMTLVPLRAFATTADREAFRALLAAQGLLDAPAAAPGAKPRPPRMPPPPPARPKKLWSD